MRSFAALALGLLFAGLGLYGGAIVTPLAFPGAFSPEGWTTSPVALFVLLAIAAVFTAFGGWVTARLVEDHQRGHAILMAAIALVPAVMVGAIRWAAAPSWYYVVQWMLLPVAAAVGAAAWERTMRRGGRATARRIAAAR